jgi:hypothetical protein
MELGAEWRGFRREHSLRQESRRRRSLVMRDTRPVQRNRRLSAALATKLVQNTSGPKSLQRCFGSKGNTRLAGGPSALAGS